MKIFWTKGARKNLNDVERFVSQENPKAAIELVIRIIDFVEILVEHPEVGRPGRVFGTRELVIPNTHYIVPYQSKGNVIYVLRVVHSSMKWPEKL